MTSECPVNSRDMEALADCAFFSPLAIVTSSSHLTDPWCPLYPSCSWWKAKLKSDGEEEGSVGLVPASYVEEVSQAVSPTHTDGGHV